MRRYIGSLGGTESAASRVPAPSLSEFSIRIRRARSEVSCVEPRRIYDDNTTFFYFRQVYLKSGRIHCYQNIILITGCKNLLTAKVDLEA